MTMSTGNNERISHSRCKFKTSIAAGALGLLGLSAVTAQASAVQLTDPQWWCSIQFRT